MKSKRAQLVLGLLVAAVWNGGCDKLTRHPAENILASENFDYPDGQKLAGSVGGTGFAGAWQVGGLNVSGADDLMITKGSLIYPGIESSGNRLVCKANGKNEGLGRELPLSFNIAKGRRYLSFLIRPEGPTTNLDRGRFFGVTLFYGPGTEAYFGKPGAGVLNQYTVEFRGGSVQHSSGVTAKIDETALVIIRADFDHGRNDYTLYVNPGITEPTTGAAFSFQDPRQPQLTIFADSGFSLDEIRVAEHYEDVAPKPPKGFFSF